MLKYFLWCLVICSVDVVYSTYVPSKNLHEPQGRRCPPNEIWLDQGVDCATCENYMYVKCAPQNISKCYCLDGRVRNDRGQCVYIEECPKEGSCRRNEVFREEGGIDCQTCDNYWFVKCPFISEPGCYCEDGYVRNARGRCVSTEDCPKKDMTCPSNEVFATQGFDCQTCDNYWFVRCRLLNEPRCYCEGGYVRNSLGQCVHTDDCPITEMTCPPNEVFATQGFDCQTCDNYWFVRCLLLNEPRCYCEGAKVRHSLGQCVDTADCPITAPSSPTSCGVNEVLKSEGFDCQTCDNYWFVRCPTLYEERCYCLDNYVRDANGQCVATADCPACGVNEVMKSEGIDCQTCDNYWYVKCLTLYEERCYCLDNYVRDANGECVATADCPGVTTTGSN